MTSSTERRAPTPSAPSAGPALLAWIAWGLAALFFAYAFFQRVAPSVMIDQLMADLGVSGAVLGNLSAFYFYAYAALQLPVGILVDRWGPRRVLTTAIALCAVGSLLSGAGSSLTVIYLGRLLVGAGAAFSFVGTLKLATNWFPAQRFALLSGLTMMAGMAGGIGGQVPLAFLVEAAGWRGALIGAGVFGAVLAAVFFLFVRDRPPQAAAAQATQGSTDVVAGLKQVARRRHNWLLALIAASMSAPLLAFAGLWGVSWLMQVHAMTRPEAAATTSLLLIGWAVGAPLSGFMSDRLHRRKLPLMAGAATGLLALLALLYLPIPWTGLMAALFFLTGVGTGCMVLVYALAGETNPAHLSGTAYAFPNMFTVASGAVFQPVIGLLLDLSWQGTMEDGVRIYASATYGWAFSVLPAFLVLGLAASLLIRESGAARKA